MDKDNSEVHYGRAVDRSHVDSKASFEIASELDQILESYGDERENGIKDVSWNSYELGVNLLLLRGSWSGETQYALYITDHTVNDDGVQTESMIVFTPGKGVTQITGGICDEIAKFGVGSSFDLAEIAFKAYMDTCGV